MIFKYMEENGITNFGYVILFEEKPSLSILLDNHDIFNDIVIDSDENIYGVINEFEMYLVGVTITNDDDELVLADTLDDDNVGEMTYTITPLFLYTLKTPGLTMDDFVDLELMDMLFYDVLDDYIKERND
jgi:hypothetical protein